MGIQPQNAMTAQGYLNSLRALGATPPTPRAPGTAFDGGYDPQAARRKSFAEIWGSGVKGASNYNPYMDRNNPMNRTSGAGVMGQYRGHTPGVDSLQERAMYGLGGTGPTAEMRKYDQDRVNNAQKWRDTTSNLYAKHKNSMMPRAGGIGDPLYEYRQNQKREMNTTEEPISPSNPTPGIYVPGQKPAPFPDETPSDNSIPTPPTTKPIEPGGLGGMPASTPIGSPYSIDTSGSTPGNEVMKISASPQNPSGNPLMNTLKPKQKPKFGTLGANRGMNGMGLGPNSVAKPGTYGTY